LAPCTPSNKNKAVNDWLWAVSFANLSIVTFHHYKYGISFRMFLVSTAETRVERLRFLLRFFPLLDKIWLLKPLLRLILPLPVILNLFIAALLLFILGT